MTAAAAGVALALALPPGCQTAGPGEPAISLPAARLEPLPPVLDTPPPTPPAAAAPTPPAAPTGRSVQGRPIQCFLAGQPGPTVLVLGGIHGNEPAGVGLCEQLYFHLRANPAAAAGRTVVIVPAVNPDGLAMGRRANARGVDLNRNFDTRNRRPGARYGPRAFSEPESRFVAELIRRYRPDRVITVHQPLACVDYDGPARHLAETVSRAAGLPVRKLGACPGSLGSYAGIDRRLPTLTVELPAEASRLDPAELWRAYGPAMLAAVGCLPEPPAAAE